MVKAVINIAAVIFSSACLSQKTKRPLITAVPTILCLLMILLHFLSLVHALDSIDVISLAVVTVLLLYFVKRGNVRKDLLLHPSGLVLVFVVFFAWLMNRNTIVNAWDDINYWAATVRSLFERNGLEGRYYTVGAGWGDYPLGQQLIEWWFVHSFGNGWNENLLFIGYYCLLCSFVMPVAAEMCTGGRKIISAVIAAAACVLFVLIQFDNGYIQRLNADVLMAVAYGGCIVYILRVGDNTPDKLNVADVIAISIQLAGIALIKSIGIFWSAAAALLFFLLRKEQLQKGTLRSAVRDFCWFDYLVIIPTVLVYASWKLVCKLLSRQTYLVNTLLYAERRTLTWYWEQAKSFFEAMFLQAEMGIRIGEVLVGLSPVMLVLLPSLCFLYFRRYREYNNCIYTIAVNYVIGVAGCYILILLYAYETMFSYEATAINSVSRYFLPCILLVKAVAWHMFANWKKGTDNRWDILVMTAVLLCSYNIFTLPSQIYNKNQELNEYKLVREEYERKFADFHSQIERMENRFDVAVYYCSEDMTEYDRIHLCYLANGTVVHTSGISAPKSLLQNAKNTHATHIFVCRNGIYTKKDYQKLMEPGTMFEFEKIYEIAENEDSGLCLRR